MSTGAILFTVITLVLVSDTVIALYFRSLADRVESGETVSRNIDPPKARQFATLMLVTAPLMWLVVTLIAFGVIPTSIDPIKF